MFQRIKLLLDTALMFFMAVVVRGGYKQALIVVDMQNDFVDKDKGTLSRAAHGLCIWVMNLIIRIAEYFGWMVIFTRDWHPDKTSHFDKWPAHCVAGTWGAMFYPSLYIPPMAFRVSKGMGNGEDAYSGFDGKTDEGITLLDLLESHHINTVYVMGAYLDYCVKETCKSAKSNFFVTYLISFATCPVNFFTPEDGNKALVELNLLGVKII